MKKILPGVLVILLLGSDSPRGHEDTVTEMDALQGSWLTVSGERNSVAFVVVGQTETLREGKFTTTNAQGEITDRGTYFVDLTRRPGLFSETPAQGAKKGVKLWYIVQLDGDRLKVGYKGKGTEPPKGFDDTDLTILTCKRIKK